MSLKPVNSPNSGYPGMRSTLIHLQSDRWMEQLEEVVPDLLLLDWTERQNRHLGIRYLLCRIAQGRSASIFAGHEHCEDCAPKPCRCLDLPAHYISFQLLDYTELLYSALTVITHSANKSHLEPAVSVLFNALWHNDLVLQQMLYRRQPNLWRAMIEAVLSFDVRKLVKSDLVKYNGHWIFLEEPIKRVMLFLYSMMRQWKAEQWEYAMNNGLCLFIKNANINDFFADRVGSVINYLYWSCMIHLQRLCRRTGTELQHQFKRMMIKILGLRTMHYTLRDTTARDSILTSPIVWKIFSERYCSRRGKYICKGCRLIRYCCRKHQKAHWKRIHSQQCHKLHKG